MSSAEVPFIQSSLSKMDERYMVEQPGAMQIIPTLPCALRYTKWPLA
jgi:hypothetical protein